MNKKRKIFPYIVLFFFTVLISSYNTKQIAALSKFPYKKAGLTERQAAAHLLSRFTYGAKPGDIDYVLKVGIENWFFNQLAAAEPDDELLEKLKQYNALTLTNKQVLDKYPRPAQVLKMAEMDGYITKDSVTKDDKDAYKALLSSYMNKKGLLPLRELHRQFINQKIIRATYSQNQLKEVLTDFWFNHFNVAITKNDCAQFIPAYERDVIRPNVLGNFEDLLISTAKSPAMLMYLDNFSSSGINTDMPGLGNPKNLQRLENKILSGDTATIQRLDKIKQRRKNSGLNENYAREVMELHTMGVDGGYTQQDVTDAAKILTGWTVYPMSDVGPFKQVRKGIDKIGEDKLREIGFVHDGDFLFAANRHDNSEKIVLGKKFNSKNGYSEGVELLKMLAHHNSTSLFICRKLAVRFVSDNPPQQLIDEMSKTFLQQNGNIKATLITMVSSPHFWSKETIRQKIKSPFELVISTIRCLDADVKRPFALYQSISKMGQKMYAYQAPTGFPDASQYWINSGSLLNRMNFGLAIVKPMNASVDINLLKLNNGHEPESASEALEIYSKLMMPERDINETITRLTPLLNNPVIETKVADANARLGKQSKEMIPSDSDFEDNATDSDKESMGSKLNADSDHKNMLTQVVGIIIGSPEFQRR